MQPQRETITDNLADIIHIIHLGNRSGTLTVERGEGEKREEGLLIFLHGKIVDARVGSHSGLPAFNYLNTWRTCRFAFMPQTHGKTPSGPSAAVPHFQPGHEATNISSARPGPSASAGPIRLRAGEVAIQYPESAHISRTHWRLLLLIDGKRTKYELARLTMRSFEEIQELLKDLEQAGLIDNR
jgi:hypothetical protein